MCDHSSGPPAPTYKLFSERPGGVRTVRDCGRGVGGGIWCSARKLSNPIWIQFGLD